MNYLNFVENISKEIALYSTIAIAGFIFIIKIFKSYKNKKKQILKKNMILMLMRNKLYFINLNKEILTFKSTNLDKNDFVDIKSDKINNMQQYVKSLSTKCEIENESFEKEKNEEIKISTQKEKLFCYFLKNISQLISKDKNQD